MAETLSKFFVKSIDKLDITEFKNISNIDGLSDPVEIAIKKYEKDIETEILNLNTKKAVASNSIPAKVLKETSDICSRASADIE